MKNIKDIEQTIFGYSTHSRSKNQRWIRKILRNAGLGVGQGQHYKFTEMEFHDVADLLAQEKARK